MKVQSKQLSLQDDQSQAVAKQNNIELGDIAEESVDSSINIETESPHNNKKWSRNTKVMIGILVALIIITPSIALGLILGRDTDILSDVVPDKHNVIVKEAVVERAPHEVHCPGKRCCKAIGDTTVKCTSFGIDTCVIYRDDCEWDCLNNGDTEKYPFGTIVRRRVFVGFDDEIGRVDGRYDNDCDPKYNISQFDSRWEKEPNDDKEFNTEENVKDENDILQLNDECRAVFRITVDKTSDLVNLVQFYGQNPNFGSENGDCDETQQICKTDGNIPVTDGLCDESGSLCSGTSDTENRRRLTKWWPDGRKQVTSKSFPWKPSGYLRFVDDAGDTKRCSATLIGRRHVITAAHCIHGGKGGSFFTNFRFWPSSLNSADLTSANQFVATGAWVFRKFITKSWPSAISEDIGILRLSVSNTYKGWYGFTSGGAFLTYFNTHGYPVDKPDRTKWRQYCLHLRISSKRYLSTFCDTANGQSGSNNYHYWESTGQRKIRAITSAHGNWYARVTSGKASAICGIIASGETSTC